MLHKRIAFVVIPLFSLYEVITFHRYSYPSLQKILFFLCSFHLELSSTFFAHSISTFRSQLKTHFFPP